MQNSTRQIIKQYNQQLQVLQLFKGRTSASVLSNWIRMDELLLSVSEAKIQNCLDEGLLYERSGMCRLTQMGSKILSYALAEG